jgi:hypothetical protein
MYSTNAEYRAVFRAYFKMDVKNLEEEYAFLKDDDPESFDEMLYDETAVSVGMKQMFEKTKDNTKFIELYRSAAARFFTEDLETGVCVLLTFDYFADYIALYTNPDDDFFFQKLKQKI